MAKVKVINGSIDSNLNGNNFNNTPSNTIFSFGSFTVTSNFDGRKYIDYSKSLSTFVTPITLEILGVNETQSDLLYDTSTTVALNLNKSDLNTFVKYGSAYEFLRTTIENVIINYTGSLFINSQLYRGNATFTNFIYNSGTNTSEFNIPTQFIVNTFGLVYNNGNSTEPDGITDKNLNLSFNNYIIWSSQNSNEYTCNIIGYTGNSTSKPYVRIKTSGNPFSMFSGATQGILDFHIRPNNQLFEEFRTKLSEYEKYLISNRTDNGFSFTIKNPILTEDGSIIYTDLNMLWATTDRYNIDTNTSEYRKFLESFLTIGAKYDSIKTDLIARFLTPSSIKTYDLTNDGKIIKLLRTYGWEFDQLRQFIDSMVYINTTSYDKINNLPDQLVKNLAKTFGWNYFSLINESELVESFFTIDETERNLHTDLMPAEIDIELWRRILLNTNYFWKSKGTREAIKSMFLLIGIPEPFINITEYVYTVDGRIDPRSVTLSINDFPSQSLPYDNDGYPIAPLETNNFYFQVSGDTDNGQAYMDIFRSCGFNLTQTVDNKKSWVQTGATIRIGDTMPQYYQEDSKLILNTKEIDVALDTSRGVEYDVFDYVKNIDFPINSSGYTLPYSFINLSLNVADIQNIFPLPSNYKDGNGDLEVRFNGMLLAAPIEYSGNGTTYTVSGDYIISGNSIILNQSAKNISYGRDVIEISFIESGDTIHQGISIKYMVVRINVTTISTIIPLPDVPSGDVQLTLNGIALTKGSNQFTADYIVNPNNSSEIIIQNPDINAFLATMPIIQVAFINVIGTSSVAMKSEVYRIDSFTTGKVYYSNTANRYVYKLNYKINNEVNIKVLIDGIALEPIKDYISNPNNLYEIYLPSTIKYGSVISVYYLIAGTDYYEPLIWDGFGLGDISKLSFLEFIELVQRRLINATNRKTVTNSKGGWYPTLSNIYDVYIKRSLLSTENPLQSNGYTFSNLYTFLNKYNTFFQKFVDQLLSATVILRKSGLLIRNTVFTRQKFTYKRGVNLNGEIVYSGDDGSLFKVLQPSGHTIPPPEPPVCDITFTYDITAQDMGQQYTCDSLFTVINGLGSLDITITKLSNSSGLSTAYATISIYRDNVLLKNFMIINEPPLTISLNNLYDGIYKIILNDFTSTEPCIIEESYVVEGIEPPCLMGATIYQKDLNIIDPELEIFTTSIGVKDIFVTNSSSILTNKALIELFDGTDLSGSTYFTGVENEIVFNADVSVNYVVRITDYTYDGEGDCITEYPIFTIGIPDECSINATITSEDTGSVKISDVNINYNLGITGNECEIFITGIPDDCDPITWNWIFLNKDSDMNQVMTQNIYIPSRNDTYPAQITYTYIHNVNENSLTISGLPNGSYVIRVEEDSNFGADAICSTPEQQFDVTNSFNVLTAYDESQSPDFNVQININSIVLTISNYNSTYDKVEGVMVVDYLGNELFDSDENKNAISYNISYVCNGVILDGYGISHYYDELNGVYKFSTVVNKNTNLWYAHVVHNDGDVYANNIQYNVDNQELAAHTFNILPTTLLCTVFK